MSNEMPDGELLDRFLSGEASAGELADFSARLRRDPAFRRAYLEEGSVHALLVFNRKRLAAAPLFTRRRRALRRAFALRVAMAAGLAVLISGLAVAAVVRFARMTAAPVVPVVSAPVVEADVDSPLPVPAVAPSQAVESVSVAIPAAVVQPKEENEEMKTPTVLQTAVVTAAVAAAVATATPAEAQREIVTLPSRSCASTATADSLSLTAWQKSTATQENLDLESRNGTTAIRWDLNLNSMPIRGGAVILI